MEIPLDTDENAINIEMKLLLGLNSSGSLKVHEVILGGLHFKAGDAFHQTRFSIRATLSRILRRITERRLPLMRKRPTGAQKKRSDAVGSRFNKTCDLINLLSFSRFCSTFLLTI